MWYILCLEKGHLKIRMVLDARKANRRFRRPPNVPLCTTEGFGKVQVELPEGLTAEDEEGAWLVESATSKIVVTELINAALDESVFLLP